MKEKKLIEVKLFIEDILKRMILENSKQCVLLVMKLQTTSLICTYQTLNKTIWQSMLKILKSRQDHNIKTLTSAMTLLKGRQMVFEAFESGIFSRSEQSRTDDKLDNDLSISSNESHINFSSDLDIPLFTPKKTKKKTGLRILTSK